MYRDREVFASYFGKRGRYKGLRKEEGEFTRVDEISVPTSPYPDFRKTRGHLWFLVRVDRNDLYRTL